MAGRLWSWVLRHRAWALAVTAGAIVLALAFVLYLVFGGRDYSITGPM